MGGRDTNRVSNAAVEAAGGVRPTPETCRRSLALRHILPVIGTRVLGRLMRAEMNRSRSRLGLRPAAHAFCANTVQILQRGTLVLEGGYLLEDGVRLVLGTDGSGSAHGTIVVGHNVALRAGTVVSADGGVVRLGENTYVGFQCVLLGGPRDLMIGCDVMFGPQCLIAANDHGLRRDQRFRTQALTSKGITVADNVWVGGHATIVDGVSIGSGSVVAAGSVVTRDVPAGVLVAGVPARIIRELA